MQEQGGAGSWGGKEIKLKCSWPVMKSVLTETEIKHCKGVVVMTRLVCECSV